MSLARPACLSFLLIVCQCSKVDYQPAFPAEASRTVHHVGAYSSKMGENKEVQGTQFLGRWKFTWKRNGDGWILHRRLDTLGGRGYHKNSMPGELEKRVDLDIDLGPDRLPRKISGYDTLHQALRRIDQKPAFRDQLLAGSDTLRFQALQRDLFRLRNLLAPGVREMDTPIEVDGINGKLETLKVDSARYQGQRPRNKTACLEYEVFFHREDTLSLLVEQFFFSASAHRKWRKSKWNPATVRGLRHFSLEQETGLPCFESITETAEILLKDPEDKSEQPVTLYRYEEDLYVP